MFVRALLPAALVACAAPAYNGQSGDASTADYLGPAGRILYFQPAEVPAEDVLYVQLQEGAWALRQGTRWRTAEPIATWDVALAEDGISVDGTLVLPSPVGPGTTIGDATVESLDDREVRYGTFENTATVTIASGDWAGEQAWAKDFGPVRIEVRNAALDVRAWELVGYDDDGIGADTDVP
jgi:hypothetical protein